MINRGFCGLLGTMGLVVFAFSTNVGAQTTTALISVDELNVPATNDSRDSSLSGDGRYVVFESSASLVSEDTNGFVDIYRRDRETGEVKLVSISEDGMLGNGGSEAPSISANGRFIAFQSYASNLVDGDTNGEPDIFVADCDTGDLIRINLTAAGEQATGGGSFEPDISANGKSVAFESYATNLGGDDSNGEPDIFAVDLAMGGGLAAASIERVSMAFFRRWQTPNSGSLLPSISGDGRYVAFYSFASNLILWDKNDAPDVFVYDRKFKHTELISKKSFWWRPWKWWPANNGSYFATISADGRSVAYVSYASNLVSWDTNNQPDVFVYDRKRGKTERVNVSSSGVQANSGSDNSYAPSLSADGKLVTFLSYASNLVPGGNGNSDIYLFDRVTNQIELISVSNTGDPAEFNPMGSEFGSQRPSISDDGTTISFESDATNLVLPTMVHEGLDIYVRGEGAPGDPD